MRLRNILSYAFLAAVAASPSIAQDAAAADAAFPTAQATADEQNGVVARHGDWEIRCPPNGEACILFVAAFNGEGAEVANISMQSLPEGAAATLGVVVVTPLLTLLPRGLTVRVDEGIPASYPYSWCNQAGCYARFGMTDGQVDAMKSGDTTSLQLFTIVNPEEPINANISLTGFTAAVEDLMSR